jgi:ACS family hexuronate transporter-like MFS transporter
VAKPIRHLRWWIGGLLFLSTVINYIDRQTLSMLAPFLKEEYGWSNTDYMWLIIAFRVAYSVGQTIAGRWLDRLGTRTGLSLTVLWYSAAAWLTAAVASGRNSFAACRFLFGLGEAGNWPGATKAVSEWFPKKETGWAVALFDSGSSIGGAIAGLIIVPLYLAFDRNWRPVFALTGALGFFWILAFRWLYDRPETHPRITPEERAYILDGRADQTHADGSAPVRLSFKTLLRLPQTWGYILSKSLTDPVWFFITDWFPIFLVAKGFRLESSLVAVWVPFIAADLGNFFGGGFSSYLIKRGWSVAAARKVIAVIGGLGMTLLIPAIWVDSLPLLVMCFAVSTFCYAAFSTIILNLPADLYPTGSVASASGLGGTGAGIGTILATLITGYVSDHYSFRPILAGAGSIALVAMVAVLVLVRNTRATDEGVLNRI